MTALKDYLGTIVSEVASARAAADLHTAEIAKVFSDDELLAKFTIPKFRFGSVELDIPFLVNAVTEPIQLPHTKVVNHMSPEVLADMVVSTIDRSLRSNIDYAITGPQRIRIADQILHISEASYQKRETMTAEMSNSFSLKASQSTIDQLKKIKRVKELVEKGKKSEIFSTLDKNIKETWQMGVRIETKSGQVKPGQINILADHSNLKENAETNNIARIRMTLYEDDLEHKNKLGLDGEVQKVITRE